MFSIEQKTIWHLKWAWDRNSWYGSGRNSLWKTFIAKGDLIFAPVAAKICQTSLFGAITKKKKRGEINCNLCDHSLIRLQAGMDGVVVMMRGGAQKVTSEPSHTSPLNSTRPPESTSLFAQLGPAFLDNLSQWANYFFGTYQKKSVHSSESKIHLLWAFQLGLKKEINKKSWTW